ncbi:MAG: SpoIIE family protein phosphatase [Spirochaetia bacterium]|nr:SpoIIE family protein phosphatase [Spirochaetia bacterium]
MNLNPFSNKTLFEDRFTLPAKRASIPEMKDRITKICRDYNFSYKDLNNLLIVLDEACSNIIRHAYKDKEGGIDFEITVKQKGIHLTLIDHGIGFEWKKVRTPNLNHYVDIGKKGGLGVWIIRKLTDKSDYVTTPRGNELRLVKNHSHKTFFGIISGIFSSKRGLKDRFVISTMLLLSVLIAGIYSYFIYHERISLRDKFLSYNAEIVKSLSETAREMIIKENYLSLIQLLREIRQNNRNIDAVFVINSDGVIVAHNDASRLYKNYEMNDANVKEKKNYAGDVFGFKYADGKTNDYHYELVSSVSYRGIDMGEVRLHISKEGIKEVMAGKRTNIRIASVLILVIGSLGIYLLMGLITRPIQRLREGALAIGEGRLDHRIELEGEDEFSQIANAFNDMATKFKGAQETLVEQEKIQKEIAVAKEIQQTLLPKNVPDTEGFDIASLYRSARDVGGDYYDILKVGPHRFGVIVADVSGKGVPGSLVMTITRTVMRLVCIGNRSAKSTLVKVNNFVKEDMKKGMFVTAFYLVLDSVSRKINFSSAGHDPLMLYRAREDKMYYIKPKGFPLGISLPDDALFKKIMSEESVKLEKDDLIVVYTDGITEAMNGKRELWGEKHLVEFIRTNGKLAPREFIDKLDADLKEFTQGYPQNDDITIVVIKEKRSDAEMMKKLDRQIANLKKKRMKVKDIEKQLGINVKNLKQIKKDNKDKTKQEIKFLTVEQKKEIMALVVNNPGWTIMQYDRAMSEKYGTLKANLVKNELKRVNLLRPDQRKRYSFERVSEQKEAQVKEQTVRQPEEEKKE